MTEMTLHIPAIHCGGCIGSIQRIVERQGAELKAGDPNTKDVTISYDESTLARDQIIEALTAGDFAPADS